MATLRLTIDDRRARAVFRTARPLMVRAIERQQWRGAEELAREMRRRAPKDTSLLTNSIAARRAGEMHYVVAPGVRYAPHVEEGAGPGGVPRVGAIVRWIQRKGIVSTRYPNPRDLAGAIVGKIRARGTRPQPFAAPAFEHKASRLAALIEQGVVDGLTQAFGR